MQVIIAEGTVDEVAALVSKMKSSTSAVVIATSMASAPAAAEKPTAAPPEAEEPVQAPAAVETPAAAPAAPQSDPAPLDARHGPKADSIRTQVFDAIALHPNSTAFQIAQRLGLDHEQVRSAGKNLVKAGRVQRAIDPLTKELRYPHHFSVIDPAAGEIEIAPVKRTQRAPRGESPHAETKANVLAYLREHTDATVKEMAVAMASPYKNVSSMATKLKQSGVLQTSGRGGNKEPYRYSILDAG